MNLITEYYQPAFALLHDRLHDRLNRALLSEPASIRSKYLMNNLAIGEAISAELAWPVARELLNVLEAEMAAILHKRSVFFWFHIYRRIGVILHPLHEDKTDPRTLALVRDIAELAISKHGRATDAREVVLSTRINPNLILGGFMRAGVKRVVARRPSHAYRELAKQLKMRPQWVIRDFSEDDFVGIYRVEGLAYQYWRVTALLRSLGKGAQIVINKDGNWDYVPNEELKWLLTSIDARTSDGGGFDNSVIGIWIDEDTERGEADEKHASDFLICPVYNVSRIKLKDGLRKLGLSVPNDFTSNFVPFLIDTQSFLRAHNFLADTFRAKIGFRLEALVWVLWAVASIVHFPEEYMRAETGEAGLRVFRETMINVLQRGYGVYDVDPKQITPVLQRRINVFASDINVTDEEIRAVLHRITLTPDAQGSISLWSGGPQHVLIPAGQHQGVFLQGVPMMLATMFVRVAHNQGQRGTVFEEAFRRALSKRGFEYRNGSLQSFAEGKRELDAGVVIGDALYAFECVSVERPLDYEIGNLATFSRRRERFDNKVSQALTLGDFLRAEPRGTNYDFTQVRQIIPLVVSPFEEWIWERSDRLWLPDGTPRILSAREALDLLMKARSSKSQPDIG